MSGEGFTCSVCGSQHAGPPTAYESTAPQAWFALSEKERAERARLDGDIAVITEAGVPRAFLRGTIEIPVVDTPDPLLVTVWIELGVTDLRDVLASWNDTDRADLPPVLGVLANDVLGFPPSVGLGAVLHAQAVGTRPKIELTPDQHPLVVAQRGISSDRLREIAEQVAHPARA